MREGGKGRPSCQRGKRQTALGPNYSGPYPGSHKRLTHWNWNELEVIAGGSGKHRECGSVLVDHCREQNLNPAGSHDYGHDVPKSFGS